MFALIGLAVGEVVEGLRYLSLACKVGGAA